MSIASQINIVAFLLLLGMILEGYRDGLLKSVYALIRWILSIIVAVMVAPIIVPILPNEWKGNQAIAFLIVFVIVGVLLSVLNYALGLVNHVPIVGKINKILGGVFGVIKWVLLIWIIFALLSCFIHVQWCNEAIDSLEKSHFLTWLDDMNPLHNFF
jgi:membrane protein required for colicin V production